MNFVDSFLLAVSENYPELMPSKLFFENDKMYITKMVGGELVTKEAMRDPHYKGNRYDWVENIKPITDAD